MGQKLDELLSQGNASVDDLARAGKQDGMTLDETARALVGAGRIKSQPPYDPDYDGSPLSHAEQDAIRAMSPEDRHDYSMRHMVRPQEGTVTTGAELWEDNDGRSPFPDPLERASNGVYRHALDESGNLIPNAAVECATGRMVSMEVVKARRTLELAEQ